jgi:GT2 family glycosyltransferase
MPDVTPAPSTLQNHEAFERGLMQVEQALARGDLEQALEAAHGAAYHAWMHHCGIFVSPRLEQLLAQIGARLPAAPTAVPNTSGRRRMLTLMSSAHAVGGHSRIAWRWIRMDEASEHTLVLTQQGQAPIPEQLLALKTQGRLRIVQLDETSWCARASALQQHLAQADQVVLLPHPHDILPCTALPPMRDAPPTVMLDHASHVFWLGVTVSRVVLNTATVVLERRRGIAPAHIGWALLPMDFSHLDAPADLDVRRKFSIPAEATLLLSGGAAFKYWPIEGLSLAERIAPVLERHSQAHLLVIGSPTGPFWEPLLSRFPGRVHLHGYLKEPELVACYQACDIYLDSLPLSSPTTLLEAAALGKPVVRYAPSDWRSTGFSLEHEGIPRSFYLWTTPEQYEEDLDRLITDAAFRDWRGRFGRQAIRLYYSDETFLQTVESAFKQAQRLPTITVRLGADAYAHDKLDELLEALTANMARQRELEQAPPAPSYQDWLMQGRELPAALEHILRQAASGSALDVLIGPGTSDALARTRASMAAQWLPARRVVEGGPAQAWAGTGDTAPWTLLLTAGDELEPEAVLQLERFLRAPRNAELRVVYFDHDEIHDGQPPQNPQFKPDANPDLLLSMPYVGRAVAVRTDWARTLTDARQATHCNLELAYLLALAALRECGAAGLGHLPLLLAHLDAREPTLYAGNSAQWQALAALLQQHLAQSAPGTQLLEGPAPGTFHRVYPLPHRPLVSIIIPTRDQLPFLSRCIESLFGKTSYPNFEVLIVDNDSQTPEAREYLQGLAQLPADRLRVLPAPGPFNFSRMNNQAARQARGEFLLLLNNDTAALQADWLEHLVRNALREDVGIVGARLLYPDGRVQHAGVIMGLRGPAEHPLLGLDPQAPGYMMRAQVQQDFSVVTAACLLVRKDLYETLGGLDEDSFGVSYNDVDFCLRVGQAGKRIVWTPLATLLHEGSASQKRSIESTTQELKIARFSRERAAMYQRWPRIIAHDPAYNPNLSLAEHGYEIETNPVLRPNRLQGLVPHHVLAFAADEHGCGHYRILQPLRAMKDAGLCTGGPSPELLPANLVLHSGADTLIFQRPNSDASLDVLESLIPLKGIRKIYEVDDNLSRVPLKSVHHQDMPKDLRSRIQRAVGLCDRLVVSTEALARELAGHCADTRVVLNRLPPAMWGATPPVRRAERPAGRKPRVGWAGGMGHRGDLELIADLVRDLADQVDWVFFGMCPEALRPYVHSNPLGVPTPDYPSRLMEITQDWDLAIAPLELNAFNECKSNLKLLEYGWCGVPVVCTDITPYQCNLPATRVRNRYKDWREAILGHLAERDATHRQGLALQSQVAAEWTLTGVHLDNWYRAWTD